MKHGANQSTDTKYATCLVCDAIELLASGRIESARIALIHAATMLPDIGSSEQANAIAEFRRTRRGMESAA